jgi:hypothetical protein
MLDIDECRRILGEDGKDLSDARIIELRDSLQGICERVLDKYFDEQS